MKECKDCGVIKEYSEFVPKPSCKDGYEVRCRVCRSIRYNKSTPERLFKKIFLSQCTHSIKRGHPLPTYTFHELKEWVNQQPHAYQLWEDYVASGYNKDFVPSIDRLDDYKGYSLTNIQLITWKENKENYCTSAKRGINTKNCRPVSAYHLDGTFYKTFYSTIEASRVVGGSTSSISSVANGVKIKDGRGNYYLPRSHKNFIWKWAS